MNQTEKNIVEVYIPNTGFKALRKHYRKTMVSHIDSLIGGKIVSSIHKKNNNRILIV